MNYQTKNYEVISELGHGAQGSVYLVRDEETQETFAAKVYDKSDRLSLEERILKKIMGQQGFPQIVDTTEIEDQNVIIMQILGDNLRTLKDKQRDQRLSLNTSLQVLYQLICRLETLHKLGYVHCDIKPDNMLISANSQEDLNIYLVDFGLAHSYIDRHGSHVKPPTKVTFKGTISYCSLNLLDKQYPSRRDDLESLIYVVLFLYYGQLPWHHGAQQLAGRERLDYVIRMKQDLDIRDYGDEIPQSILKCYSHIRKLHYDDEPNYALLKSYVSTDLACMQESIGIYDWSRRVDKPVSPTRSQQSIPKLQEQQLQVAAPKQPIPLTHRKQQASEINDNESRSMEAEYKDFMSIELDEGEIEISLHGMDPKQNQLSSLSPHSMKSSDNSVTNDGTKSPKRRQEPADFKAKLNICLMPFDFAGDDDFDVLAMQQEIKTQQEMIKTQRKQSSFGPTAMPSMEAIRQHRKYSVQVQLNHKS